AVIEAAEQIAERQKALDLRKASIKAETDRANAEAEASGQLARAEQDKRVAALQREAFFLTPRKRPAEGLDQYAGLVDRPSA
ncbi:MAG: hypothetical protein ACOC06_00125, partial [Halorubrum sp.]